MVGAALLALPPSDTPGHGLAVASEVGDLPAAPPLPLLPSVFSVNDPAAAAGGADFFQALPPGSQVRPPEE